MGGGDAAGVTNTPAALLQADGDTLTDVSTEICIRIWRTETEEWSTPWTLL